MKATMHRILCALLGVLFSITLYAQANGGIAGDWAFTAAGAPAGYDSGILRISPDNGKLTAELVIGDSTVRIGELKKSGEAYTCIASVDEYPVLVTIKQKGDGIEGTATADDQIIPIIFKRVAK